ncbi:MAG: hypothetical protein KQH63_13065 [Desulfobulbaceae bacterium]|nr:hypothetical protein [Desulfobulbaceae bacterium]
MLKNKLAHILFLLLMLLPTGAHGRNNNDWIAVLLSDSDPVYVSQTLVFADSVDMEVRTFNLHGDIQKDPTLKERLLADHPSLIFALGAKAAFTAKLWTRNRQDIPVLFAMVINWQQYHLLEGQTNLAGISSEVNPGNQFLSLSMLIPGINKVGVIVGKDFSAHIIDQASQAATMLGIELIVRRIDSSPDYQRTYRELAGQVDSIWVLNDPLTYTIDNLDWLEERCIKDKQVCFGQRRNLAELGFMLSVQADMGNIAAQAASMAINIIQRGQRPADIGIMEPLGVKISVNRSTAESLGIELSSEALALATEVLD